MKRAVKILTKFSGILVAVLLLLAPSPVTAAGATLSLSPTGGSVNKGCSFKITINLNTGGQQTDGTDAILKYDPAVFTTTLTKITNGTIYPDYPGNSVDAANGRINVSGLASVNQPFSSSGVLATVEFTVKADTTAATSPITFDFDPNNKAKTTDSNVVERGTIQDLLDSVVDGNYTVGSGACSSQTVPSGAGATTTSTTTTTVPRTTLTGGQGAVGTTPSGELPPGAITTPTVIIAAVGGFLTLLGIIGLAIL